MRMKKVTLGGLEYTVYEDGTVYGSTGKRIKQRLNKDGYWIFTAGSSNEKKVRCFTHRIVAMLFVPNPYGYNEVDHLDGNRANPSADNLEWVTHHENVRRAAARGSYSGERNSHAKLKTADVINIRQAYKNGSRLCELARQYNMNPTSIRDIVTGKNWKCIPMT